MSNPDRPPLIFSAFVMNTTSHIYQGTWRHPDARNLEHNSLEYWVELAKLLEAGTFDLIFFADVVGLYGDYRGDYRKYVETGLQIPANDPAVIASALAYATEHLGIAFTSAVVQEHPFSFARKISTLDHASGGRIAWNVVTSYLKNAFANFGYDDIVAHDARYDWADEYLDVAYKLWEGSWDEGALVQDKAGLHADFDKVHKIHHLGRNYKVEGPHLVAPSPQRTPLIFQAGSSPRGQQFAARHAEGIFVSSPTPEVARQQIEATRQLAAAHGRSPEDLKFLAGLSFVVGSTEEEARRRAADLDENWIDWDGHLAHFAGSLGIDLGHHDLDAPVGEINVETVQGIIRGLERAHPGRPLVVRDLARFMASANRIVGTPEQIADRLAEWRDAGVDGVNVMNVVRPGDYEEFIEHVTPVLQRRGLQRTEYAEGTLRRKLFGTDRLNDRHPAARYRGAFNGPRSWPEAADPRAVEAAPVGR
ncbi:LLM class flavin-dependent oxidoreductase [Georgenia thermotolerans]|uniref:NtaA/DmoA family FMN-dependent monooxygenase n=1 Tax=Georgenia thermotolerans TaxID=527326 RepID=A0A7J5UT01_9MICO|nr:LLM class flavin-dependent oxidoreductase [Georgenia thermotolerans]KAE8765478.1 NtaA/DmoA family FMN-dependent monooxygenase [Georgenia thermotolerans]